jgi:hemoglobin
MKSSHAHLNISEKEWDVMAGEFKKSLDKFGVPAAEQNELFEIVGKTKVDIVLRRG